MRLTVAILLMLVSTAQARPMFGLWQPSAPIDTNLVAWHEFDADFDVSGIIYDSTSYSNNAVQATANKQPVWTNSNALVFDGVDDWYSVPESASTKFTDGFTAHFVIEGWNTTSETIMGRYADGLGLRDFIVRKTSGALQMKIYTGSIANSIGKQTGYIQSILGSGVHVITYKWDGGLTPDSLTFYTNGVVTPADTPVTVGTFTGLVNQALSTTIGALQQTVGGQEWEGTIYEARIYNKNQATNDIKSIGNTLLRKYRP